MFTAIFDALRVVFWSFVIWDGGPRHDSFGYAWFARGLARERLNTFLRGNEDGRG
jgi:hypothetical protein